MKSKRQIYAEMLREGLLFMRSQGEGPMAHAICHVTADFLHNVPQYIFDENFEELDFYFLNIEISSYRAYCEFYKIPTNPRLLSLAEELRQIVPEELKSKLKQL